MLLLACWVFCLLSARGWHHDARPPPPALHAPDALHTPVVAARHIQTGEIVALKKVRSALLASAARCRARTPARRAGVAPRPVATLPPPLRACPAFAPAWRCLMSRAPRLASAAPQSPSSKTAHHSPPARLPACRLRSALTAAATACRSRRCASSPSCRRRATQTSCACCASSPAAAQTGADAAAVRDACRPRASCAAVR